jgi:hypothetical protein
MAAFLVTNIGAALTWTYLFVGEASGGQSG